MNSKTIHWSSHTSTNGATKQLEIKTKIKWQSEEKLHNLNQDWLARHSYISSFRNQLGKNTAYRQILVKVQKFSNFIARVVTWAWRHQYLAKSNLQGHASGRNKILSLFFTCAIESGLDFHKPSNVSHSYSHPRHPTHTQLVMFSFL